MGILNNELNRIHHEMAKIADKYFGEGEKTRWIPINKKKPNGDHVLLTVKWDEDDYEVLVEDWGIGEWEIAAGVATPLVQSIHHRAVAWMPMPKPWSGERREDG